MERGFKKFIKSSRKKIILFALILFVLCPASTVLAQESPTTSNPPTYQPSTTNVAYAPIGTEQVINGVTFRSLGNGTYKNLMTGQVYDGNGKLLYTIAEHTLQGGSVTFGTHGDDSFVNFIKVSVDDIDVDAKNYTASEGSVIIKLGQDFIDSLAVGKHKMTCYFNNKEAVTSEFTIVEAKATTQRSPITGFIPTGDVGYITYVLMIGGIAAVCLAGVLLYRNSHKSKNDTETTSTEENKE